MTLALIKSRITTGIVTAAIVAGAAVGTADRTVLAPAAAADTSCHVPAVPGTYTCTVTVDAAPSPSPSAAPSASPSVAPPTPSPTTAPTPAPIPTVAPTPTIAPTPTPSPVAGSGYGSGIAADTLNNLQVGGTNGPGSRKVDYRFRATQSSSLNTIRIYVVDGSGYSGGTGGTFNVTVQSDAAGRPSGTVLATSSTVTPGNPIKIGYLPQIAFPSPAQLTAGTVYHLVFTNTDPSPRTNYVSTDLLYVFGTAPAQFAVSPDWIAAYNDGSGWTTYPGMDPILDLGYGNGIHAGQGYMEVWIASSPKPIGGSAAVREQFTVTNADRIVRSISVRLLKASGSGALSVALTRSDGTVLASGSVPAANVPVGTPGVDHGGDGPWQTVSIPATTLSVGQTYDLLLTAPSGTSYSAYPIRQGSHYSFSPLTYFSDGTGQFSTNGTIWSNFPDESGDISAEGDLQFWLGQ